jgi:major membrane immunogen (membrane-anchored lipoprotein)
MNQKTIILTILLAFLTILGFSQKDFTGTYQAWFDICDRNDKHFSMTIEIDTSDIVHFTYQDDTQKNTATGKLKIILTLYTLNQ